jgi:hypothetical protein
MDDIRLAAAGVVKRLIERGAQAGIGRRDEPTQRQVRLGRCTGERQTVAPDIERYAPLAPR